MQKLMNINDWTVLEEGKSLKFEKETPRHVRLHVNAPAERLLYIRLLKEKEPRFLALVKGLDGVDFYTPGAFEIMCDLGSLNIKTFDGQFGHLEHTDHRVFTEVVARRPRNPELELMNHIALQNMNKRMAAAEADHVRRLEAMLKQREIDASNDQSTGNAKSSPKKPKPAAKPGNAPDGGNGDEGGGDGGTGD